LADPDIQDLYERIWYGVQGQRVQLGFDLKLLNKPGSPVFSARDALLPWMALLLLAIGGWRVGGWIGSAAAVLAMLVLMATTINYAVMKRLRERSEKYALSGHLSFEELWQVGAISLRIAGNDSEEFKGPSMEWTAFARQLPKTEAEKAADRVDRNK
jgi:hypothetical protein